MKNLSQGLTEISTSRKVFNLEPVAVTAGTIYRFGAVMSSGGETYSSDDLTDTVVRVGMYIRQKVCWVQNEEVQQDGITGKYSVAPS